MFHKTKIFLFSIFYAMWLNYRVENNQAVCPLSPPPPPLPPLCASTKKSLCHLPPLPPLPSPPPPKLWARLPPPSPSLEVSLSLFSYASQAHNFFFFFLFFFLLSALDAMTHPLSWSQSSDARPGKSAQGSRNLTIVLLLG